MRTTSIAAGFALLCAAASPVLAADMPVKATKRSQSRNSRARMPALGSVKLLLVQLLRSDPLLSARDALLVGLLTNPRIPNAAAVASSPARRRVSSLELKSLGVNAIFIARE